VAHLAKAEPWWIASYSALRYADSDAAAPETATDDVIIEYASEAVAVPVDAATILLSLGWLLYFDTRLSADHTVACATCHRVSGMGTRKGPDLTDIGSLRTPSMLQQTLNDPSGYLLPINRPVRATTKEDKVVAGRRLNEDTYSLQIIDESGRLLTLLKADLKDVQVLTTSLMPSP